MSAAPRWPASTPRPARDYSEDPEPYFQTQLRILAGRELAGRVVDRLHLETVPEFNGQAPQRTGLAAALHSMKSTGARHHQEGHRRSRAGAPSPRHRRRARRLTNQLLGSVNLEPVRGSRLVNVSMTSASPTFAARTADALVEEYVKQNFAMRSEATQKSLTFLDEEIEKQKAKVEDSEREMADYREHNNALSLDDKQNTVSATLNQLNDQYTRTKTERIQKETLYKQVEGLTASTPQLDTIPAITSNLQVQALRQRLIELNRTKTALNERYGEKNPKSSPTPTRSTTPPDSISPR